jgi:AcrR family transcriptional regulator
MFSKFLNLEAKRRDAIINAALKEFSSKGFDAASTNIIAKEAGISKGLMFHYINSKEEFYLFLYDYCTEIVNKEYFDLINFHEKDIFQRLRQIYLLQIELLHKYPWILQFTKIAPTKSDDIKVEPEEMINGIQSSCYKTMFSEIDEAKFREGLDIEKCKQLIFWANLGFTNKILDDIRVSEISKLDYGKIITELDSYLNELEKCFYK